MFDDEIYFQQKEFFLAILRAMKPAETASEEMRDAFQNAVNDFYFEEL